MFKYFIFVVSLLVAIVVSAHPVKAITQGATYDFLAGDGIVCGLDPSACPAVAVADNGDTIELTGHGTLRTRPRTVTGQGTIIHKSSDGTVVGEGTWKAVQLLDMTEYGCGGDELPDEFCGGRAHIRIQITPNDGRKAYAGILRVDCLIGDQILEGAVEGIRLDVLGVMNFDSEVSGFTLFIRK